MYHPYKISIELKAFCFTTRLLMTRPIQLNLTILETIFMMTSNLSQAWHYIGIECLHQNLFLPKGKQPSRCRASEPEIFRFYYWCLVCLFMHFQEMCMRRPVLPIKKTTKRILYPVWLITKFIFFWYFNCSSSLSHSRLTMQHRCMWPRPLQFVYPNRKWST